jgi:hypothetical protein
LIVRSCRCRASVAAGSCRCPGAEGVASQTLPPSARSCRIECDRNETWRRYRLSTMLTWREWQRATAIAALIVSVGTTLGACTQSSTTASHASPASNSPAIGHVATQSPGQTITVSVRKGCPNTLGDTKDVATQPEIPGDRLLPTGQPSAGLICEYTASPRGETTMLLHRVQLDAAKARALAVAVGLVSLKPATGAFNCPDDLFGTVTVIAFDYSASIGADLWYTTSGCRTLDNGHVSAFEGANPSFYSGFESAFNSLVPKPAP